VRHVVLVAVVRTALSVHGAAMEAQHRSTVRRVVVHREEQMAQQRAVDAVVPRGGRARERTLSRMSRRRGSCAGTRPWGAHAAKNRVAEGVTEPRSAHCASPSVARTCLAMRVRSPLQRCCVRLRAILDSLTGWAGWYARRRLTFTRGRRSCRGCHGLIASPGLAAARRTPLVSLSSI
jgi:hypothetical protein